MSEKRTNKFIEQNWQGRIAIFKVHLKPLKLDGDIDALAEKLAQLTPGFVGNFLSFSLSLSLTHTSAEGPSSFIYVFYLLSNKSQ
jgi:hypothetical protein